MSFSTTLSSPTSSRTSSSSASAAAATSTHPSYAFSSRSPMAPSAAVPLVGGYRLRPAQSYAPPYELWLETLAARQTVRPVPGNKTPSEAERKAIPAASLKELAYGPCPESPAGVEAWVDTFKERKLGHFISNQWVHAGGAADRTYRNVVLPQDQRVLCQTVDGTKADVDAAVDAAAAAQVKWAALSPYERGVHLYSVARHVQKHARLLAVAEALDNGKPFREAKAADVPIVARHFYHHAGWAQTAGAAADLAQYEPVGVVGAVIPWNFPLMLLTWKVAPALAMGNTVVVKPAPHTFVTALLLAHICAEAGLPPGVLNVVTGDMTPDGHIGTLLATNPKVCKLAFTGSTPVGKMLRRTLAGSGKKLSLELGGKNPFVVFDDADLDSAVEGVVDAIWFNQGQVCCAGSRALVHERVLPRFLGKLKRRMQTLRLGHSLEKDVDMGPLIAKFHLDHVTRYVDGARAEGADVYQAPIEVPAGGFFFPPTIITGVKPASACVREEIFGPVVTVQSFAAMEEAVEMANSSRFGLAASIWTENLSTALEVAFALKAGSVWVNSHSMFDAAAGFGGYKESGYGRDGGLEGLYEYVKMKKPAAAAGGSASAAAAAIAAADGKEAGGAQGALPTVTGLPLLAAGEKPQWPAGAYGLLAGGGAGPLGSAPLSAPGVVPLPGGSSIPGIPGIPGVPGVPSSPFAAGGSPPAGLFRRTSTAPLDFAGFSPSGGGAGGLAPVDVDAEGGADYVPETPRRGAGDALPAGGGASGNRVFGSGSALPMQGTLAQIAQGRTAPVYINGKVQRSESDFGRPIRAAGSGEVLAHVAECSRKDVRAALDAAAAAAGVWGKRAAFDRGMPLFRLAEALAARAGEIASRIASQTGRSAADAAAEVDKAVDRLFYYGAYADKFGGTVKETQLYGLVFSVNEPAGVVTVICPNEYPLLGFVSLVAPCLARGNAVVVVPSTQAPLSVLDLLNTFDALDLPAGALNVITGERDLLARYFVESDDVATVWYRGLSPLGPGDAAAAAAGAVGSAEGARCVEYYSADSMKRAWVDLDTRRPVDWMSDKEGQGLDFLRRCSEVKNIWIPMGDGQA